MTTTNTTNTITEETNTLSAATATTITTHDHPPTSEVPPWVPLRRAESMESTMSTTSDYYLDNLNNSGHGGRYTVRCASYASYKSQPYALIMHHTQYMMEP